jgi:polyisoprenoid-binding protein YceI
VRGDLTLRGVTRPVELEAEIEGAGDGPDGTPRMGISATGAIDRSEWGITWNAPLANGALAVAERVTLTLHVEAVLQTGSEA